MKRTTEIAIETVILLVAIKTNEYYAATFLAGLVLTNLYLYVEDRIEKSKVKVKK